MKIVHENIKKNKCKFCEKSFGRKHSLVTHVKNIHENIKDYKCESCGICFSQKGHLETHLKQFMST